MAGGAEHRLVIDRFEGDLAVVEVDGGATLDLPCWLLPDGVKEGDHLAVRLDGGVGKRRVEIRVDEEATGAARREVGEIVDRLKKRDPGGDLAL
ncbi:MAG TPA: DUF3006 domain-containing protein [Longimicrobiaceae bacterium]|nr:DUF3006 domain-containing protein [Longimicrobiaceae bacterium]